MTFDELLAEIAKEPVQVEDVYALPPGAPQAVAAGGLPTAEMLHDPRRIEERRTFRKGHVLGAPASAQTITGWEERWHALPGDLRTLLTRANGIHLWADLDTGRSYEGLAPVEEWMPVRMKMYGQDADDDTLPDKYVAVSYHTDGAAFVVLDVDIGRYFLMDSCGPDETCPIGDNTEALLAWLWNNRIA